MTNIVGFRPARRKSRKPRAAHQPFELLFFTGIRYMRMDEPIPEPAPAEVTKTVQAPARRERHA